jgi:hypothetical protein
MAQTIVPEAPKQRRTRGRMRTLRAMKRLGLLEEENLISTLAERPELRWLADERGARWAVLAELGRIGEREAFDEAVQWALEAHPQPYEARAYVLGGGPAPTWERVCLESLRCGLHIPEVVPFQQKEANALEGIRFAKGPSKKAAAYRVLQQI